MGQMHTIGKTATKVIHEHGQTDVRYHETIVTRFDEKTILLNTGGWFTNTTKARMNQASSQFNLGYKVFQAKGVWYCAFKGENLRFEGEALALTR